MNINKGLIGAATQQEVRLPIKVKYCLYARKSSESEERQALSIDSQIKEMTQLAEKEKLEIVETKQESFSAKATSQRPVFNEMVEGIKSGRFNGILTWATDRLSRNAVATEIKADYLEMRKLKNMKPKRFVAAVRTMKRKVIMKSATMDNGIENRDHEAIGTRTFFCDPYSSWQKPHVENAIRLVRRFIPKGSNLGKVPETKIARVARILNHKPRKSLSYQTPHEVMVEQNLFTKTVREKIALRG